MAISPLDSLDGTSVVPSDAVPSATLAERLRTGEWPLADYIDDVCDRLDEVNPRILAVLPEQGRRDRLMRSVEELLLKYEEPGSRPPLFGIPFAVKDVYHVTGFPTRAGSALPPRSLRGRQGPLVSRLISKGALVLGKTVTAEFAGGSAPGATRNPLDLARTPGGSSSGSAAIVAAGVVPMALGTQTAGSTIRPAAYCGIVGFMPSADRVSTAGTVHLSPTQDRIGLLTQDIPGVALLAESSFDRWIRPDIPPKYRPTVGVPDGAYLELANPEILEVFETTVQALADAGCAIVRFADLGDLDAIRRMSGWLILYEIYRGHKVRYAKWGPMLRPETVAMIERGAGVTESQYRTALEGSLSLRERFTAISQQRAIDVIASPATVDVAPVGYSSTGSAAMNTIWTYAGMPALTLPVPQASGMPFGLQLSTVYGGDECLIHHAETLSGLLRAA